MPRSIVVQESTRGGVLICPEGVWLSIGRSMDGNDLVIASRYVSRRHCRLRADADGGLEVIDTSSFGTFYQGERIGRAGRRVLPGDLLEIGKGVFLRVLGRVESEVGEVPGPAPLRRFGERYLLLRELGRGASGVVHEGWDIERQRRCAIKWLREGGRATEEAMERFRHEAALQKRLRDYPGIVTIYDLGVTPGSGEMFCVMELVEGDSLLDKIRGRLERAEGVRLVARVARAVGYAHGLGVVHRDLKPGNVLVTADGSVRLTDFGIAKAIGGGAPRHTQTGIMLGTPGYMAPEQIEDAKRVGPPADIYALGAILYTVLTGKLPVRGRTMREALQKLRYGETDDVPTPREIDPSIDPVLESACLRALAFEPSERWESADVFAEELERWLRTVHPPERVKLAGPGFDGYATEAPE